MGQLFKSMKMGMNDTEWVRQRREEGEEDGVSASRRLES